jgi:hypothetical protein
LDFSDTLLKAPFLALKTTRRSTLENTRVEISVCVVWLFRVLSSLAAHAAGWFLFGAGLVVCGVVV